MRHLLYVKRVQYQVIPYDCHFTLGEAAKEQQALCLTVLLAVGIRGDRCKLNVSCAGDMR